MASLNKWSLYQDSDLWEYCFPAEAMEKRGVSYPELLKQIIIAFCTSDVFKLIYKGREIEQRDSFLNVLDGMLDFIKDLHSKSGRYPGISTDGMVNSLGEYNKEYIFQNGLYVYDKNGAIIYKNFSLMEMELMLREIQHGQAGDKGITLPFDFNTFYDKENGDYVFLLKFRSDILLNEVTCVHCFQDCTVEQYEALGGFEKVLEMRYDNSELAALNRENMNDLLNQMEKICADFGGRMIVEQDNLETYKGKFGPEGFIL